MVIWRLIIKINLGKRYDDGVEVRENVEELRFFREHVLLFSENAWISSENV